MFVDVGGVTRLRVPDDGEVPVSSSDAYPYVVADQREIYGQPFADATEVHRFWVEWLAARGRELHRDIENRSVRPRVEYDPQVCRSRWVAICPTCHGGMACWDRNPSAACLDCGIAYEVDWHPPDVRAEALRLLAQRPAQYRGWLEDETVDDLRAQNATLATLVGPAPQLVVPDQVGTADDVPEWVERVKAGL